MGFVPVKLGFMYRIIGKTHSCESLELSPPTFTIKLL